jgi:threonine-phosphate decarboxylase
MAIIHGGDIFASAARMNVPYQHVLDFSASINPLGPSPAAREAILTSLDHIEHYPSRSGSRLRTRLAEDWHVEPDRVLTGNGATELLFDWCRYFGSGSIGAPAFGEFHRAWPNAALFALDDGSTWPRSGPVVLTRPANPTGYLLPGGQIREYAAQHDGPVLVDESFIDFTNAASLAPHAHGNLYVLRSLTKFHALPGLRVGALVGDVAGLAELRPPWTLNTLAEEAALASLDDRGHARRTREFIGAESAWLAHELGGDPPSANYVFVRTPRAAELTAYAASRQVLIRDCGGWPGLRVSGVRAAVRRRLENEILVRIFREFACD